MNSDSLGIKGIVRKSARHPAAPGVASDLAGLDRIVREDEVRAITGLSRSTRWRLKRRGEFPAPVQLSSGGAIGWRLSEIAAWLASRQPRAGSREGAQATGARQ